MEHENSFLYAPVNALWHGVQHRFAWNIPDHVIMALLVLVISTILFAIGSRHISRDNPGPLQHFMGLVLWLAPLMFIIEMIGNFARILSLGVRLFGNIFGEHTATGIFTGLVPVIAPMPMMALGIFGALLQTYVFIMLTTVYIA